MKKLVILGGGYGGLTIANELLEKDLPSDTLLVLVDRMPYQGLKTEYYALASGTVADTEIRVSFPVDPRLILKYGEVAAVDPIKKQVLFENDEPLTYDWLVIGLGCVDKYHSIAGAAEFSESIQTLSSTRKAFQAVNDTVPYGQVTIVGGGLSGVEMASELRESRPDLNIRILDRGASVLSAFPQKLQLYVTEWMMDHDIELRSHINLTRLESGLLYDAKQLIHTDVAIWTAGIQPSPIVQNLQLPKDPQGRLVVNEYHQIPDFTDIFVVGDCASLPFSPSAQAAESQGKQIAEVIRAMWKNETPKLGKIKLKGVLGSLGKKAGFGMMGRRTIMTGKIARALKSGVLWMSKHHFG
ncbi:NAD(P)/FAD-dependent oxidoreductase [Paenibacillus xerothermodurans]|uniref:NAD(P)/FAD-dependent oxidoreductase n=1 Tax=Paenibacillus xerothermodurans TaxID=1977292 RepID=A0A2W1NPV2_PAEXE|nr:NAD(P)/FAD-dependent oxidoreductase [Paenibacillus xerothermodurans]PZE21525.1 NAD(P)/FAD-dependent oxidoreductase [Paenibacillus xerothermodurans]